MKYLRLESTYKYTADEKETTRVYHIPVDKVVSYECGKNEDGTYTFTIYFESDGYATLYEPLTKDEADRLIVTILNNVASYKTFIIDVNYLCGVIKSGS